MSGIESRHGAPPNVGVPLPIRLVRKSSEQIAHYRNLDSLSTEALAKFAVVNFRIKDIATDFRETASDYIGYVVHVNEGGTGVAIVVYREIYSNVIQNLSAIAFNLYNTYLSGNENTRTAAKEVQGAINDLFPSNP